MKKLLSLLLALALVFSLAACGSKNDGANTDGDAQNGENTESVDLVVFAAASMTETLTEIAEMYKEVAPNVNITYNFDSSGKLLTQISEGADCDLFISAAPQQMNAMDGSLIDDKDKNPDGLDLIVTDSRIDLLENKVTLAVPEGNPKGIESFDQLAELLKSGDVMLAIGNSDVPVGQYTLKIFNYYGIDETAVADKLTYGNNVKEVTSQVSEAAADCGIIYATDACSAGLTVVDSATAEMCGQVIYPAAVLKGDKEDAVRAFLAYLQTDAAMTVFESVGFSPAI
mgnify:CR=1 FL=1